MQVSQISATITRPADTTTYTIGDVVGASSFQLGALGAGLGLGGEAKSAACITSANVTTKPDLQLWLFSAAVASVTADNAAFAPTDAEMTTFLGRIDFPVASFKVANAGSAAAGNAACIATGFVIPLPTYVFGVLVVQNAYVPVSAEVFTINLNVLRSYAEL